MLRPTGMATETPSISGCLGPDTGCSNTHPHLLSTHYMLPRTLSFDPDNAPVDRRDYRLREVGALTQGDADSKSCCCTWAQVRPLPTAIVREPKPSPSSACSWVVSATRAAAPSWEGQSLEQSTPPHPLPRICRAPKHCSAL